ncbi:MAG: hypothetical protein Roseis2KO_55410 [Roseivirga sp.]
MSQQTNPQQDDDDYDVIIEESGVGDPTVGVALSFSGTSKENPLKNVNIKFAVLWEALNDRTDIGEITVQSISGSGPYRFAIPYDAIAFDYQVNNQVNLDLWLIISAENDKGRKVKLGGGQPIGGGYLYVQKGVVPQIYKDS